jgi:hypothetical protein
VHLTATPGRFVRDLLCFTALVLTSGCSAHLMTSTVDGRLALNEIYRRVETTLTENWQPETLYRYPDFSDLEPAHAIRSWRTTTKGPALWIIAGIHGEEPAGPNAIAQNTQALKALSDAGVPIVLIPVANPIGYQNNWRYPNTPERDWKKGGYSVGDSEHLLPDTQNGSKPRASNPIGPEAKALTQFVLREMRDYPPRLVLDLHEDELSRDGGYIYSQGLRATDNPIGSAVIRILQQAGIPLRLNGRTRFDEPIFAGVVSRDAHDMPIRDGSIDELLSASQIIVNGQKENGPGAPTVIVIETPAFSGARLDWRVSAHGSVLRKLTNLWALSADVR